tara:strand:- start:39046 stop:39987 length:942 start_codon:yes stop_codon:yes gene_type:complete
MNSEYKKNLVAKGIFRKDGGGLTPEHISSREEMYKTLPSNAIVAEIGVDRGHNSLAINRLCTPKELYLIDPWDISTTQYSSRYETKETRKEAFKHFADNKNVTIIQDFSVEASKKFDNHYFDWIHLDGSITYKDAKMDLAHWLPKVKRGGYITQDAFDLYEEHWSGVYGAVIEFIIKYVEKRPDILRTLEIASQEQIRLIKKQFANWDVEEQLKLIVTKSERRVEYYTESRNNIFSNFIVLLEDKLVYSSKVSPKVLELILKHIDYFPSRRERGGSYKLQIGDWVDDLDYEEIIEEANKIKEEEHEEGKIKIL